MRKIYTNPISTLYQTVKNLFAAICNRMASQNNNNLVIDFDLPSSDVESNASERLSDASTTSTSDDIPIALLAEMRLNDAQGEEAQQDEEPPLANAQGDFQAWLHDVER